MTSPAAGFERIALFSSCLPGWDADRVLRAAVELGFGAVEWGVGPGQAIEDPACADELAGHRRGAGVGAVGRWGRERGGALAPPHRGHRAALSRLVELAARGHARVLVETSPGTLAASPELALS